ncbi:ACT domain-containing protein [Melioribacteraceae bacterium 4301-Me]|uniref:ACT domain-containing protein n=1 Tax=Pyranulibacter aquaticus TaxID=3163344 RepID=UPI0035974D6A
MKLKEEEIRKITLDTIAELGEDATPELVKQKVREKIEKLADNNISFSKPDTSSGRVILTAFGLNKPGIVAAITKSIAESNCDIQDLSQKLMGDFFTMIMIVDLSTSPKDLKALQEEMAKVADELKIKIYLQHEDVFKYMHRI